MTAVDDYKLFRCLQCGFEYDEALGWPDEDIAPGTRWDEIPDDWSCPDCGAAKADFEMVEVGAGPASLRQPPSLARLRWKG